MKKFLLTLVLVVALTVCACTLVACNAEDDVTKITGLSAELDSGVSYSVDDKFDTEDVVLTATLSDGTQTVIVSTAATTFDKSDLKLDENGKFTQEGTFTLKIKYLTYETTLDVVVNK